MNTAHLLDVFDREMRCEYKGRIYLVRDNGAICRLSSKGYRPTKLDNVWTFGKPNDKTGYMLLAGQSVHRIVAFAFLGNPPSDQYVVDHVDTNRRNNRPDNLRWVTRLENVLNNPITRARIENLCGIEAFLADPSVLRGHEKIDPNFSWMRAVSKDEARTSYENLLKWSKEPPKPQGGSLGEWVFQEKNSLPYINSPTSFLSHEPIELEPIDTPNETVSLTPNAVQVNWHTPSEFPCCPKKSATNPLEDYKSNMQVDSVFCKNDIYSSLVIDAAITDEGKALWVMTRSGGDSIKPWALAKVVYKDGKYIHESMGSFFDQNGAKKYFTLAQGKEWTGGDVFDDYC